MEGGHYGGRALWREAREVSPALVFLWCRLSEDSYKPKQQWLGNHLLLVTCKMCVCVRVCVRVCVFVLTAIMIS